MIRTATIGTDWEDLEQRDLERVQRYLPSNYSATLEAGVITITGEDNAGWTMQYVIDRLASGLIYARETTFAENL